MIDVAIVGAGPAGLSAAVNAAARNKKAVVFGKKAETSMLYKAEVINNHLGMQGLSGKELINKFYQHASSSGVEIREGRVFQIMPMDGYFTVNFQNEFVEARSVILAVGASKSAGVKGEVEFLGRGVSYCATCDGMLYRNKDVVVVGEIEEAEEDANFLVNLCSSVKFFSYYGEPKNLDPRIEVAETKIEAVLGTDFVEGVVAGGRQIDCAGAFFIKSVTPPGNIIFGLELSGNVIKVNRYMETNLPGVFAAGDCTGWPFQLSNAIGEGMIAAQQAARYLDQSAKRNL